MTPILQLDKVEKQLSVTKLNAGQREAVALIVSAPDRIVGVQGYAGVGKSHLLKTAKTILEREGAVVRTLAPYGGQVKALRDLGMEANTLASFLRAIDKKIDARTVLIIDEAGIVPTRQMEQALKLAEQAGARVVRLGDTAQTKAIEAGRPFDQLQAAGMRTAKVVEIQRQRDPVLKAAVELAAAGDARGSLRTLNAVTEIADKNTRRDKLVADFMTLTPVERDATLILAGTNEARRAINARVREAVGTAGQGAVFDTLSRRDSTQVERRFSKNYHVGDVVQPEKDYKTGLQRGALYRVVDTGPGNRLTVVGKDGRGISFSPMHAKVSVYQLEQTELAKGDRIRINRNDAALNIATGERFSVSALEPGSLVLEGYGRTVRLPTDAPVHLDHAYVTTVHSAQGMTADRVLIEAETGSRTTAKDVYYVAISRARFGARIYTDDAGKLPASISRENLKLAAMDIEREKKPVRSARSRSS
jgi:ATP-dependent exoDNAse (exonuclease V) alpha subunit